MFVHFRLRFVAIIAVGLLLLGFLPAGPWAAAQDPSPPARDAKEALTPAQAAAVAPPAREGAMLYARHCAACHGEKGDAQGAVALFLFPKPRNFQTGRFKLISTTNNVPTRDDLHAVLLRGMPGSSMPPWGHLPERERELLIDEIILLRREGVKEQMIKTFKEEDELTDEQIAEEEVQNAIREAMEELSTPGESLEVPPIGPPTKEGLEEAKTTYAQFGCLQCHGETGKGDGVKKMFDDDKYPTAPRDFTVGIFKGGDDPASLYRRIAYGMPGTPMPGAQQMTPEQRINLVHYVLAMSTPADRSAAVLKRESLRAPAVASLPSTPADPAWRQAPAISPKTMPLWWRNDAEIDLQVRALHDRRSIAIYADWKDVTQNGQAIAPEEFEDMAALEIASRGREPFLGMGSKTEVVDVWHWRAGHGRTGAENHLSDEYPFETEVYRRLAKPGEAPPDFITARAAGNPLAQPDRASNALVGGGPGSLTFRPKTSQLVTVTAEWKEGRWRVIWVRPLAARNDEGLALKPQSSYSIAFAFWDGAARDRAGQKSITIWNDLVLE